VYVLVSFYPIKEKITYDLCLYPKHTVSILGEREQR